MKIKYKEILGVEQSTWRTVTMTCIRALVVCVCVQRCCFPHPGSPQQPLDHLLWRSASRAVSRLWGSLGGPGFRGNRPPAGYQASPTGWPLLGTHSSMPACGDDFGWPLPSSWVLCPLLEVVTAIPSAVWVCASWEPNTIYLSSKTQR